MPQLDTTAWVIWGLVIGCQLSLSWLMRRHWKRWCALASLVWFKTASSLFLLATYFDVWGYDNTPAVYFYGYWSVSAISDMLQVWLIIDLCAAVLPLHARNLRRAILGLCVVYLCAAAFLAGSSSLDTLYPHIETRLAIGLDRAASLAWLGAFISLYYASASIAGIHWARVELGVAIGLTLKMIGETGVCWLLGSYPQLWHVLSTAEGVIWTLALLAWIGTFISPERPDGEQPQDGLSGILNAYTNTIKKLRAPK